MNGTPRMRIAATTLVFLLITVLAASCGGKKEAEQEKPAETGDETLEFIDESVSYGLFFDEAGTKRTTRLKKGQEELICYMFVMLPDYLEIAATQFRIELPEGVVIENDKYRMDRIMSMGTFSRGISERYAPCLKGPKALIHTFTLRVTVPLDNAVFSVLQAQDAQYLAVTECKEGFPLIRASAYKAVVNPSE
jgi:hypothetical protein